MSHLAILLVRPSVQYKNSFASAFAELETDSDRYSWIYLGETAPFEIFQINFEAYVNTLLQRETQPPPGFVCDTVYWALHEDEVVGRISIRHELNDFLKQVGGHVGYIVRPSARNKGIASEMLRQLLQTEKAKSIGKLLLTCDENNFASEKTILKNYGIFERKIDVGANRPLKKHFWIQTGK